MNATARAQFLAWTDCLLDEARSPGEQLAAARAWCAWGLRHCGFDELEAALRGDPFCADTTLPAGRAISPLAAARCVWEYQRTAVFLRAVEAAIRAAQARFPGETIHVLEAGCGPLAPFALAMAARFPADEVQFSLLDFHPEALDGARRLAEELGVASSLRALLAADATTVRLAESERPHVIVCEVLLRALKGEPQVAATLNLAPQLREGGGFVPERIDVVAGFAERDSVSELGARRVVELGPVFSLDAAQVGTWRPLADGRYAANSVVVPPHAPGRLELFTRIAAFGRHRLGDFESSLNMPERVTLTAGRAELGGVVEFSYEVSSRPGLRWVESTGADLDAPGQSVR